MMRAFQQPAMGSEATDPAPAAGALRREALLSFDARGAIRQPVDTPVSPRLPAQIGTVRSPVVPSIAEDADSASRIAWVRRAISAGRARLAIQPVCIGGSTEDVAFYEGLLRLLDDNGLPVAAAAFIDAVEGHSLIVDLDCAMVRLATVLLRRRRDIRLSINVSPLSLTSPRWRDLLACCLAVDPSIARRLIIELTERARIDDLETVRAVMADIRAAGVQFALDDFGAGFTLMTHLRDLPFDIIKLDGGFTRGIETDETQRAFVRALSDLAAFFSLPLVAEQVETKAEAEALQRMGITHMQGYLFGRPSLANI